MDPWGNILDLNYHNNHSQTKVKDSHKPLCCYLGVRLLASRTMGKPSSIKLPSVWHFVIQSSAKQNAASLMATSDHVVLPGGLLDPHFMRYCSQPTNDSLFQVMCISFPFCPSLRKRNLIIWIHHTSEHKATGYLFKFKLIKWNKMIDSLSCLH